MAFNSVPADNLVLWNGRKLRELNERLQRLETKFGVKSGSRTTSRANNFVMVTNDTGSDWDRGRLIGLGDSLIKPGDIDGDLAYERQNVFEYAATEEGTKKFGITANSAPDGRLAKVIVSGFANAVVNITDLDHQYAQPTDTDGVLESTDEPSPILILFANAVGPAELCKVLIGICCGSSASEPSESFSEPSDSESFSEPSDPSNSEPSDPSEPSISSDPSESTSSSDPECATIPGVYLPDLPFYHPSEVDSILAVRDGCLVQVALNECPTE